MAGQVKTEEGLVFVPNVRPEGIEYAGDRHWRDWRLRKRRPELRERYTATFPNINPYLDREAKSHIAAEEKVKLVPFTKRRLDDLQKDPNYRVERLQFRPLQETYDKVDDIWSKTRPRKPRPQEELDKLPGFFFEALSSSLFARVWDFAAETFGQQPAMDQRSDAQKQTDFEDLLHGTDWTYHFLQHLPPDFIRCVSQVARGDFNNRGWKAYDPHGYEFLFLDRDQRIHLCTAVIAKLLQEQCFDSLLFGALKVERQALSKTDVAQEDIANGFARKMSRTSSVPKYLVSELLTTNFWQEVDRVTIGILDLLLPMINFVGELERDARVLPLTEVHQQLHNIVAEAGWIANGLAFTRSCFWIDFPQPGQLWDVRQEHVTDVVWKASKSHADYNDVDDLDGKVRAWRRERQRVYNALVDDHKPALAVWSRNTYERDHPRPRLIRRTAKVQIAMWPFFERSYPFRQELVSGDFNLGDSTTVLQKAQVVYYAGNDADAGEQEENITLQQYLDSYKRKRSIFRRPLAWIIILLLLALYFAYPRIRSSCDEIRHRDWNITNRVVPGWNWPTWKMPIIDGPRTRRDEQLSAENLPDTSSQSSPEALSILLESIVSSSSLRSGQEPRIRTSNLYSTRTWTTTHTRTRTIFPEDTKDEKDDDLKLSATTVPFGWSKDTQPSKHSRKPSPVKPIIHVGEDSSSTTVVPDTVHAAEPTEEPSPVPIRSVPTDVSSTTGEALTEQPTSSKPTKSQHSFWERLLHLGGANKESQKVTTQVPTGKDDLHVGPTTRGSASSGNTKIVISESDRTKQQDGTTTTDGTRSGNTRVVINESDHAKHQDGSTTTDGSRSGNTKVVINESDRTKQQDGTSTTDGSRFGNTKIVISESDRTKTQDDDNAKAVSTGRPEDEDVSSAADEQEGTQDMSKPRKTTSTKNWQSSISSAWSEVRHFIGDDDKPVPSFTTDLPPDVVFTDPAQPGETLDMDEGFWVQINPLGFEYNCFIKSRTADCTSTVWTTVTAEPTGGVTVTEGPWKPTV